MIEKTADVNKMAYPPPRSVMMVLNYKLTLMLFERGGGLKKCQHFDRMTVEINLRVSEDLRISFN